MTHAELIFRIDNHNEEISDKEALKNGTNAAVSLRANRASYYFLGGMLSLVGGILEFFLGNTFPFVVFTSFSMLTE